MIQKTIKVDFAGNMKINADVDGTTIHTDQTVKKGGDGTAPSPFQLFLGSMATCAGVYAKRFCEARKIDTEGLGITVDYDFDEKKFQILKMTFNITLPEGFPEKYRSAIIKAVDQCAVKKNIKAHPEFETVIS